MNTIQSARRRAGILGFLLAAVAATVQGGERDRCHAGAYRDAAGRVLALTPSEGKALRFYLHDGRSGLLAPAESGDIYTAGPGWNGNTPVTATARLGSCDAETIQFDLQGGPAGRWKKIPLQVRKVRFDS